MHDAEQLPLDADKKELEFWVLLSFVRYFVQFTFNAVNQVERKIK